MRLLGKKFRAVVFTLVVFTMVVPAAGAASARDHDRDVPGLIEKFERLVRIVAKKFGTSSNTDSLTTPRP